MEPCEQLRSSAAAERTRVGGGMPMPASRRASGVDEGTIRGCERVVCGITHEIGEERAGTEQIGQS